MGMGVISDDEFEKELAVNGPKGTVNNTPIIKIPGSGNHGAQGRSEGDNNVPDALRNIIAEDHLTNGRASAVALASNFGVSPSSVSAYSSGRNSTAANKGSGNTKDHLARTREKIASKARKRLHHALNHITEDKLAQAKLTEVSSVAKDMAAIIKQMEPEKNTEGDTNHNVQVILYAPRPMQQSDFPVMRLDE